VNAIHNVMMSSDPTPFNCGNPDEYTIKETAELVIKILGSSSKIKYLPLPKDDPKRRRPDIGKLQSVSDYKPSVAFEDGIKATAEFFKNNL
jgi:nucleoside-diphosphate-sugar epimerase